LLYFLPTLLCRVGKKIASSLCIKDFPLPPFFEGGTKEIYFCIFYLSFFLKEK